MELKDSSVFIQIKFYLARRNVNFGDVLVISVLFRAMLSRQNTLCHGNITVTQICLYSQDRPKICMCWRMYIEIYLLLALSWLTVTISHNVMFSVIGNV